MGLGPGAWGLGSGAWDLGPWAWDLGSGAWVLVCRAKEVPAREEEKRMSESGKFKERVKNTMNSEREFMTLPRTMFTETHKAFQRKPPTVYRWVFVCVI